MSTIRTKHALFCLLSVCLLGLLAACGTDTSAASTQAAKVSGNVTTTSTAAQATNTSSSSASSASPPVTTVAMPPTQTSCPPSGTARALVTAPLALGKHPNVVYTVNEMNGNVSTFGTLKRYDVTTGNKTEIVKLAHVFIDNTQVSADGQWLLFVSNDGSSPAKLQAVRMDGQGLQTLYCGAKYAVYSVQWSTNQKLIAFSTPGSSINIQNVMLLNVKDGTLETLFSTPNASIAGYSLHTWLDTSRLYLTRNNIDQPPTTLFVLDITKGAKQTEKDLIPVVKDTGKSPEVARIGELDSSYDGTQLFIDHGGCGQGGCFPPSDITVQPALGGSEKTIFHDTKASVTAVRAITAHTLLFVIANSAVQGLPVDTSRNGLWMMNTDGTGVTRLTTDSTTQSTWLNATSQLPWSNVSRDSSMYAIETYNYQGNLHTYTLFIGSLQGGSPMVFASISDGTTLSITGWTTM